MRTARYRVLRGLLAAVLMLLAVAPAPAVQPDEILKDAALESRARALSAGLRCLVCQNQSIDDSDAPLARDLRLIVRERLTAGDSDRQVLEYVVARYGEYVLLRPPFNAATALLWLSPLLMLVGVLAFIFGWPGRRRGTVPMDAPLSEAEKARLATIIEPEPPSVRRAE